MDVTVTLKGKHQGPDVEVEARNCSVHEEKQTWDYPGSCDVDYESVVIVSDDETLDGTELSDEMKGLYDETTADAIYEAWHDQEPY